MNKEELKNRLHEYIDKASEEELEEMMYLVEEDEVEYGTDKRAKKWWEDEEYIKELDRRMEEIDSGKVRAIPAEEVFEGISKMLAERKKR